MELVFENSFMSLLNFLELVFAASGPGRLAIIDGAVNWELYKKILQEYMQVSIGEPKQ